MGTKAKTQDLVWHNFGVDNLNATALTDVEWDTKGLDSITIALVTGAGPGTADFATFDIHADDSGTITPAAGNKVGTITLSGSELDGNNEMVAVHFPNVATTGRYFTVVATPGATATDLAVIGVGIPQILPGSASDRGFVADDLQT
jgi:hypothetical protein